MKPFLPDLDVFSDEGGIKQNVDQESFMHEWSCREQEPIEYFWRVHHPKIYHGSIDVPPRRKVYINEIETRCHRYNEWSQSHRAHTLLNEDKISLDGTNFTNSVQHQDCRSGCRCSQVPVIDPWCGGHKEHSSC